MRGDFFFFSERRLKTIAEMVRSNSPGNARLDFFHGFTPWILSVPERPYIAWSDCCFRDYMEIYQSKDDFRVEDLARIEGAEARWLKQAELVGFTNRWAAERAMQAYGLDPARIAIVGIFGELQPPDEDVYSGGKEFAFIATDFEQKGGRLVVAALRAVRRRHPEASLIIVGERPADLVDEEGIQFVGFLRKERPEELEKYTSILSRARAVVNASKADMAPLTVVEAGYFGCPAISSRRYAIPELVSDGVTGILVDDVESIGQVEDAMNWMIENDVEYLAMRRAAWTRSRREHSKERFSDTLLGLVDTVMGKTRDR
jgi:glycosyltransferase involved in cell wall biosynthesis